MTGSPEKQSSPMHSSTVVHSTVRHSPMRHIDVAAGIVWRGKTILCCCRPQGKPQAGFWEFPGGKLKQGEDAWTALKRELLEELGIEIQKGLFWLKKDHVYEELNLSVSLFFFHVTKFCGEPCAREGQKFAWTEYDEAKTLQFLPADKELVTLLLPPDTGCQEDRPSP